MTEPINLEPRYSTSQLPGKCVKCLAEQQLDGCLRQLLVEYGEDEELVKRYSALLSFLESPDSIKLRDEAEKYLAEGKDVQVKIFPQAGNLKFVLQVSEPNTEGGD